MPHPQHKDDLYISNDVKGAMAHLVWDTLCATYGYGPFTRGRGYELLCAWLELMPKYGMPACDPPPHESYDVCLDLLCSSYKWLSLAEGSYTIEVDRIDDWVKDDFQRMVVFTRCTEYGFVQAVTVFDRFIRVPEPMWKSDSAARMRLQEFAEWGFFQIVGKTKATRYVWKYPPLPGVESIGSKLPSSLLQQRVELTLPDTATVEQTGRVSALEEQLARVTAERDAARAELTALRARGAKIVRDAQASLAHSAP